MLPESEKPRGELSSYTQAITRVYFYLSPLLKTPWISRNSLPPARLPMWLSRVPSSPAPRHEDSDHHPSSQWEASLN